MPFDCAYARALVSSLAATAATMTSGCVLAGMMIARGLEMTAQFRVYIYMYIVIMVIFHVRRFRRSEEAYS